MPLSLPVSGGTQCHVKLKVLVVIWKLSLGFGSVFCLCTSIYWDLWCKESFKVQPYLWESPLFFPAPPLVETGQGSCAGVRDLLEHARIRVVSDQLLVCALLDHYCLSLHIPDLHSPPKDAAARGCLHASSSALSAGSCGDAAGAVLICFSCVMSHVSSFTLFLHTMRFRSVFSCLFHLTCHVPLS